MKKLSEYIGEEAAELAMQLMEYTEQIVTNKNLQDMFRTTYRYSTFLAAILKYERDAAYNIIAILNGIDVEQYRKKTDAATLINDMYALIDNESVARLFGLAAPRTVGTSSGAASTNGTNQ